MNIPVLTQILSKWEHLESIRPTPNWKVEITLLCTRSNSCIKLKDRRTETSEAEIFMLVLSFTQAYSMEMTIGSTTHSPEPPSIENLLTWPRSQTSFSFHANLVKQDPAIRFLAWKKRSHNVADNTGKQKTKTTKLRWERKDANLLVSRKENNHILYSHHNKHTLDWDPSSLWAASLFDVDLHSRCHKMSTLEQ